MLTAVLPSGMQQGGVTSSPGLLTLTANAPSRSVAGVVASPASTTLSSDASRGSFQICVGVHQVPVDPLVLALRQILPSVGLPNPPETLPIPKAQGKKNVRRDRPHREPRRSVVLHQPRMELVDKKVELPSEASSERSGIFKITLDDVESKTRSELALMILDTFDEEIKIFQNKNQYKKAIELLCRIAVEEDKKKYLQLSREGDLYSGDEVNHNVPRNDLGSMFLDLGFSCAVSNEAINILTELESCNAHAGQALSVPEFSQIDQAIINKFLLLNEGERSGLSVEEFSRRVEFLNALKNLKSLSNCSNQINLEEEYAAYLSYMKASPQDRKLADDFIDAFIAFSDNNFSRRKDVVEMLKNEVDRNFIKSLELFIGAMNVRGALRVFDLYKNGNEKHALEIVKATDVNNFGFPTSFYTNEVNGETLELPIDIVFSDGKNTYVALVSEEVDRLNIARVNNLVNREKRKFTPIVIILNIEDLILKTHDYISNHGTGGLDSNNPQLQSFQVIDELRLGFQNRLKICNASGEEMNAELVKLHQRVKKHSVLRLAA